jgi:hypothetical protein
MNFVCEASSSFPAAVNYLLYCSLRQSFQVNVGQYLEIGHTKFLTSQIWWYVFFISFLLHEWIVIKIRENVSEDKNAVVWVCLIMNESKIIAQALAMKIVSTLGGPVTWWSSQVAGETEWQKSGHIFKRIVTGERGA